MTKKITRFAQPYWFITCVEYLICLLSLDINSFLISISAAILSTLDLEIVGLDVA